MQLLMRSCPSISSSFPHIARAGVDAGALLTSLRCTCRFVLAGANADEQVARVPTKRRNKVLVAAILRYRRCRRIIGEFAIVRK